MKPQINYPKSQPHCTLELLKALAVSLCVLYAIMSLTSCTVSIDPVTSKPIFTIDPETAHNVLDSMVTDFNTHEEILPIVESTK